MPLFPSNFVRKLENFQDFFELIDQNCQQKKERFVEIRRFLTNRVVRCTLLDSFGSCSRYVFNIDISLIFFKTTSRGADPPPPFKDRIKVYLPGRQ